MKANILEPGQLSLFDIPIQATELKKNDVPKPKEVIKQVQEIKTIKPIKYKSNNLTDAQLNIINKFKSSICLHKIIYQCSGYLAVILKTSSLEFATIIYNREGKDELRINDNIPILPADKILFSKSNISISYKPQVNQLEQLKSKYPEAIEIRRKGDNNILLLVNNKIIAITPKGWVLEFTELKAVYEDEEVITKKQENTDRNFQVGNKVAIMYNMHEYTGELVYKYEMYDAFNVRFDGKQTAFHVSSILRKVG